jgi:hypothetical protein
VVMKLVGGEFGVGKKQSEGRLHHSEVEGCSQRPLYRPGWQEETGLKVLIMSQNGEGKWRGGTDLMGGEVRSRQHFTFLTPRCAGRVIGGTE